MTSCNRPRALEVPVQRITIPAESALESALGPPMPTEDGERDEPTDLRSWLIPAAFITLGAGAAVAILLLV